uniref:Phosphatidylserine decarboxylase proenzyme n=1 Tax=uncultured bacterium F39-01 TaxID=1191434 RepID=I3VID2_9BACT|nr:phosphatidylserine decarboxylase [uncultured bacterium F39-01]
MRIVRESIPYIVIPVALAIVLIAFGLWYVALFFIVIALFMAYFFRDPKRLPPDDPNVVVSPADGRVTKIKQLAPDDQNSATLISIFLSPLDVHINRSPVPGRITDVVYSPGKFLPATSERASLVNEQNALTIEGERVTVVCKQIAGILARRVVCWKKKGDNLSLGERFGMIKFSSRTDLVVPANVMVTVAEGARVRGGTTVIGRIS